VDTICTNLQTWVFYHQRFSEKQQLNQWRESLKELDLINYREHPPKSLSARLGTIQTIKVTATRNPRLALVRSQDFEMT